MPTTAWSVARGEIQRPFGFESFNTTTNIAADNSVISTELASRWSQDDFFNGWYIIIKGTTNDLVSRRITDYAASTGTLTVAGAALNSESANRVGELSRFHADDVLRAFNRARQNAFPMIGILRDIETVVTAPRQHTYTVPSTIRRFSRVYLGQRYESRSLAENLFLNSDFEDWTDATTPENWTISGSGASANQEATVSESPNYAVLSGSNSARLVIPSSTATTLLQTVDSASSSYPAVAMEGMEVNVSAWVYCNIASRVSVRIAGSDGSTHSGTGWELIKSSGTLAATATSVVAGLSGTSGAAIPAFVDEMILVVGGSEVLDHPYEPIMNYSFTPPAAGASDGGILRFHNALPDRHRLRIVGEDILSKIANDDSTIEIDGELLEPMYDLTRQYLCEERASRPGSDTSDFWDRKSAEYEERFSVAVNGMGIRVKVPPAAFKVPTASY